SRLAVEHPHAAAQGRNGYGVCGVIMGSETTAWGGEVQRSGRRPLGPEDAPRLGVESEQPALVLQEEEPLPGRLEVSQAAACDGQAKFPQYGAVITGQRLDAARAARQDQIRV